MGGQWHLPTKAEVEELITECKWQRLSYESKLGWVVKGPNNKTLFLPDTDRNSHDRQDYLTSTRTNNGRIVTLILDRYVEPEPDTFTTSASLKALIHGVSR